MDTSVFQRPEIIGPGMWFKIHTNAVHAITPVLKSAFAVNINKLCDSFRCKVCQPHFRLFIDTHPFINYNNMFDDRGRDIGYFKWTWELHNSVNNRLDKPCPTLEEAYNYYLDATAGTCETCGRPGSSGHSVKAALPTPVPIPHTEMRSIGSGSTSGSKVFPTTRPGPRTHVKGYRVLGK